MTAQFPDHVRFDNHDYKLAGVNGQGLFEPSAFQLQPVGTNSACWRGFVCEYAITNNTLELDTLSISFAENPGPTLNGVIPQRPTKRTSRLPIVYASLKLPIPFTGQLLIADQFIRELSINMGFQPAWKYITVFEVHCIAGNIATIRDVSQAIAAIREQRSRQPLKPPRGAGQAEIDAWINSTFQLAYDFEL